MEGSTAALERVRGVKGLVGALILAKCGASLWDGGCFAVNPVFEWKNLPGFAESVDDWQHLIIFSYAD